jgi:hypothetical protein
MIAGSRLPGLLDRRQQPRICQQPVQHGQIRRQLADPTGSRSLNTTRPDREPTAASAPPTPSDGLILPLTRNDRPTQPRLFPGQVARSGPRAETAAYRPRHTTLPGPKAGVGFFETFAAQGSLKRFGCYCAILLGSSGDRPVTAASQARHTCHPSRSRNYDLFQLWIAVTLQTEPAKRIGRIDRPRYSRSRKVRRVSLAEATV